MKCPSCDNEIVEQQGDLIHCITCGWFRPQSDGTYTACDEPAALPEPIAESEESISSLLETETDPQPSDDNDTARADKSKEAAGPVPAKDEDNRTHVRISFDDED